MEHGVKNISGETSELNIFERVIFFVVGLAIAFFAGAYAPTVHEVRGTPFVELVPDFIAVAAALLIAAWLAISAVNKRLLFY